MHLYAVKARIGRVARSFPVVFDQAGDLRDAGQQFRAALDINLFGLANNFSAPSDVELELWRGYPDAGGTFLASDTVTVTATSRGDDEQSSSSALTTTVAAQPVATL